MKPGRNDPCPCGSGRKYKHCHLQSDQAPEPDELAWRRIRRAIEGLSERLLATAASHFGPGGLEEAWEEFNLWDEDTDLTFDPDSPHMQVFMPWFFYDWLPDPAATEVPSAARGVRVGEAYAQTAGQRIDPAVGRYIDACLAAPFSFYEIVRCRPGRGFRLRDVFLGTECDVIERSGSQHASAGDLLFAKVVRVDGVAMVDSCGPVLYPPRYKPEIIELRADMEQSIGPLTVEALRDYGLELIELYLDLTEAILDPPLPALANTDGDPIELTELVFDIDSPRAALDALKDLAGGFADIDLLEGVDVEGAGNAFRVKFPWVEHRDSQRGTRDSMTLGMLEITAKRLIASVNSARRAAELRKLIEERLGTGARHRLATVTSPQSLLARERTPREQAAARARDEESARLAEQPEVKAALGEILRKHYRQWVDESIPALGKRTPRDAVRDRDGREAVEALILQLERDGARQQPLLDPAIVRELRETLGLEARP